MGARSVLVGFIEIGKCWERPHVRLLPVGSIPIRVDIPAAPVGAPVLPFGPCMEHVIVVPVTWLTGRSRLFPCS